MRAYSLRELLDGSFFAFGRDAYGGSDVWGYSRPISRANVSQAIREQQVQVDVTASHARSGGETRLFDGLHPGCVECRDHTGGACEYDGKLSLVRFRGRYLIYARANLEPIKGGRYVQVTSTARDSPKGPWGAFRTLRIAGYGALKAATGNIYFAAVKPNPIDEQRTLLGLFPVALSPGAEAREHLPVFAMRKRRNSNTFKRVIATPRVHGGFIGLSISCDGVHWAPLIAISTCQVHQNRTFDQPVDGFVVVDGKVFAVVHRGVPGISKNLGKSNPTEPESNRRLQPLELDAAALASLTRAAHASLPGCNASWSTHDAYARWSTDDLAYKAADAASIASEEASASSTTPLSASAAATGGDAAAWSSPAERKEQRSALTRMAALVRALEKKVKNLEARLVEVEKYAA